MLKMHVIVVEAISWCLNAKLSWTFGVKGGKKLKWKWKWLNDLLKWLNNVLG